MSVLDELIALGGPRVAAHAPLGARTTYRVGGTVRAMVTVTNVEDLKELGPLIWSGERPVVVLGNGSNLLVNDGEVDALGVYLGRQFADLRWHDEGDAVLVEAGAALDLPVAARRLAADGVVGFEWAVGVPGTFGGALVMNAGGHGSNMAASVERVTTWRDGGPRAWHSSDLAFGYRTSALPAGEAVLSTTLRLRRGDPAIAQSQVRDIVRWRRAHQPGGANAGSVFRNPPGAHAGQLIEAAGCRDLRHASAVVSDKHANFIVVDPGGRSRDVYELMALVRERVFATCGVELESEHRLVGFGETP